MAWFEELFEFMYLEKQHLFLPDTMLKFTIMELDFLEETLQMEPGDTVLDVGCGLGRHSLELALRGYEVTGLDISERMIEHAAKEAENRSLVVDFIEGDMRNITWEDGFDAALFMDVTFGMFDDEENEGVIGNVCRALRPGGQVFFALFNPYYWATHPHIRQWKDGNSEIVRKYRFSPMTGRVEDSQLYIDFDKKVRQELPMQSLRAYTPPEMLKMCRNAGFSTFEIYGDRGDFLPTTQVPFDAEKSLGLFVKAKK